MQVLKILLILLLVFFPFGELIRFTVGNNIILKPVDIISGILFLWTILVYIKNKKFRLSLKRYYFYFPLVGLASLIINSYWLKPIEIVASFLYLLRWISYMSIFFAMIQVDPKFRKKITLFLIIDGFVVVLIGFLQYFFYPNLKSFFYLGWDNHIYRLFSTFLDPNFVGSFFVLYFIFIAGLVFDYIKNKRLRLFFCVLLAFTLIAIFLTYSRSALIMLIISSAIFFILKKKKKIILLLFGLLILFILLASRYFYIENLNLFRSYSGLSRVNYTEKGLIIFKDHPIMGVGFDSYRYAQYKYHFEKPVNQNPVHNASGTDNSFIFVLATTGVIGFFCYCYLWYNFIKKAKDTPNKFYAVFVASSTGLLIDSFFNNSLFYPEIMIWMWFIISFIFTKN